MFNTGDKVRIVGKSIGERLVLENRFAVREIDAVVNSDDGSDLYLLDGLIYREQDLRVPWAPGDKVSHIADPNTVMRVVRVDDRRSLLFVCLQIFSGSKVSYDKIWQMDNVNFIPDFLIVGDVVTVKAKNVDRLRGVFVPLEESNVRVGDTGIIIDVFIRRGLYTYDVIFDDMETATFLAEDVEYMEGVRPGFKPGDKVHVLGKTINPDLGSFITLKQAGLVGGEKAVVRSVCASPDGCTYGIDIDDELLPALFLGEDLVLEEDYAGPPVEEEEEEPEPEENECVMCSLNYGDKIYVGFVYPGETQFPDESFQLAFHRAMLCYKSASKYLMDYTGRIVGERREIQE